jgi:hypothetical protein
MMPVRRYPVPETRMPFVNAEIAQVDVQGTPHLVSSVWGGHDNGRLYFWNPETGAHFMRRLPSPIPGAYMLKTGADGGLYLGCGNGDLVRYDGSRDTFETLVTGHMRGITWGGAVTARHVLWNAFHGDCNGSVAVYDLLERRVVKTFAPLDNHQPHSLYGHHTSVTPDGKILWRFQVPAARLIIIDPATMTSHGIERPWLDSAGASSTVFVDADRLLVFTSTGCYLVRYPEFEIITRISMPPACDANAHSNPVRARSGVYITDNRNLDLWRIDTASLACTAVASAWTQGEPVIQGVWQNRDICAVTRSGNTVRFEPGTGQVSTLDLEATGILPAHAFCAVPERGRIAGAPFINQRFWTMDLNSGAGGDLGRAAPGAGQINQIVWDGQTERFMMSSYTTTTVTAYDPDKPAHWPENPVVLASAADHGQMRPMALAHDGRYLWMGTNPKYGTLGGALCRIDPINGAIQVWRNLIPDQGVHYIVPDPARRRLFLATCIDGDCGSALPSATTAVLAAFDMDRLCLIATLPAVPDAGSIRLLAVLPDGRALFCKDSLIMAWDPDGNRTDPWGESPEQLRSLLPGPDGMFIALTTASIGLMLPQGPDGQYLYSRRIAEGGSLAQIAGDDLYYAAGLEIVRVSLSSLIGDFGAASL